MTISISQSRDDHLQVLRSINSEETEGVGRIATATADKIKVLTVGFTQHGCRYEATYIINSDLDNYARLTGYLFLETYFDPIIDLWMDTIQLLKVPFRDHKSRLN